MIRSYKFRLNPSPNQCVLINKHIDSVRFLYNLALECKQMAYMGSKVNLTCFDLMKQIPDLKSECKWLKEINSQTLQATIMNLEKSYLRFFKGCSNFPKFKSKRKGKQSFCVPQKAEINNGRLFIPKFKNGIKIVLHRPIKGKIKQVFVSRTPTGKYFVSVTCETKEDEKHKQKPTYENTIGIDLGVKDFLTTSEGEVIANHKYLRKSQPKLKYAHRKYSKHKGKRTKRKLSKLYEKITNRRKDFLHKVSTKLIRENQSIAVETLKISNMMKNHQLSQSIIDVSWGTFLKMLEYKAEWNGKNILKIGTFEPSSKTCSCCGAINNALTLKDREWTCLSCGCFLNRDINAARNIKLFALKKLCGTQS